MLLQIRGLTKRFPGVQALADVDFNLAAGEVHALMGENGAGKSTLIKVLTGVHRSDAGTIRLAGQTIAPSSPLQAESYGIKTVFQEINLIPHLSVAENIMLGRLPKRWGLVNWSQAKHAAGKAVDRLGLNIDISRQLSSYSVAVQQMVAIARAVTEDARVLILDEPTSSLDEKEVDELFAVISSLRRRGLGIVFVTHFLDQVYRISDRITVLRGGKRLGDFSTTELPRLELVAKMLGRAVDATDAAMASKVDPSLVNNPIKVSQPPPGAASATDDDREGCAAKEVFPVLRAEKLGRLGSVAAFDLNVKPGEIMGLAGLLGSGRTEVCRLLFGLDRRTEGTLAVAGQGRSRWSPRHSIAAGIAYCPEDRKRDGVITSLSVRENILLAMQAGRSVFRTVPMAEQKQLADHYIQRLKIKTPHAETAVGTLSGGNQQKVLLARWLVMSPVLLILDEPTRGIDVGVKSEIETLVSSLRQDGMAVLFVSSELDEVVRVCQRVAVLRDREKIGELDGDFRERQIMKMIAGCHESFD